MSTIAGDAANRSGLSLFWDAKDDPYFERRDQVETSDLEFLAGLCRDYSIAVKVSENDARRNLTYAWEASRKRTPAHRVSDSWAEHCCTHPKVIHGCHSGTLAGGSSTVFVNGRPLGRIGDPVSCGSTVASGSHNVFVGG